MCRRILCYYPLTPNFIFQSRPCFGKLELRLQTILSAESLLKSVIEGPRGSLQDRERAEALAPFYLLVLPVSVTQAQVLDLGSSIVFQPQTVFGTRSSLPHQLPLPSEAQTSCQCFPRSESQLFKTIPLILGISTN